MLHKAGLTRKTVLGDRQTIDKQQAEQNKHISEPAHTGEAAL